MSASFATVSVLPETVPFVQLLALLTSNLPGSVERSNVRLSDNDAKVQFADDLIEESFELLLTSREVSLLLLQSRDESTKFLLISKAEILLNEQPKLPSFTQLLILISSILL